MINVIKTKRTDRCESKAS